MLLCWLCWVFSSSDWEILGTNWSSSWVFTGSSETVMLVR
jgi:hypothetical protein